MTVQDAEVGSVQSSSQRSSCMMKLSPAIGSSGVQACVLVVRSRLLPRERAQKEPTKSGQAEAAGEVAKESQFREG